MGLLTTITSPQSGFFISYLIQLAFMGCGLALLRVSENNSSVAREEVSRTLCPVP